MGRQKEGGGEGFGLGREGGGGGAERRCDLPCLAGLDTLITKRPFAA